MNKCFLLGLIIAILPNMCFAESARYTALVREKQRKMEELEKCMGSTKGLKIAGLSTLGLTAVGVAGNIAEAKKIDEYQDKIDGVPNKIQQIQKQIDDKDKEIKKLNDEEEYRRETIENFNPEQTLDIKPVQPIHMPQAVDVKKQRELEVFDTPPINIDVEPMPNVLPKKLFE
jgi:cell division protein FtsB